MCFEFIAELVIKGGEFSENKITKNMTLARPSRTNANSCP